MGFSVSIKVSVDEDETVKLIEEEKDNMQIGVLSLTCLANSAVA